MKRPPLPTIVHPLHPEFRVLLVAVKIREITVPRGYVWDGASIPGLVRPFMGEPFVGAHRDAGLLHDYLYETCKVSRSQADELFYRELLADGDSKPSAYLKWLAVRTAAASHYGGKPPWPKFIDEATLKVWETQVKIEPLPFLGVKV